MKTNTIELMYTIEQKKMILYIDMDDVLVDFSSGIARLSEEIKKEYDGRLDEVPGIFSLMDPLPGAIKAAKRLSESFDVYILSTAPWKNISAWSDKAAWVHKYFGADKDSPFYKRLIITHHKNLNKGDFLIDDRSKNGAGEFEGELIQFGSEKFSDWDKVIDYLIDKVIHAKLTWPTAHYDEWIKERECIQKKSDILAKALGYSWRFYLAIMKDKDLSKAVLDSDIEYIKKNLDILSTLKEPELSRARSEFKNSIFKGLEEKADRIADVIYDLYVD